MSSDSDTTLSAGLSDADAQLLKHYGRDIMQDAASVIAEGIFCSQSLQCFESAHFLKVYRRIWHHFRPCGVLHSVSSPNRTSRVVQVMHRSRKGLKSRGRVIMLIVVVYLYAASVAQFALDIYTTFNHIHSLLMVPDTPIRDRGDLSEVNVTTVWVPLEALLVFNVGKETIVCVYGVLTT
jgi:hypothetical protein